MQDAPRRTSRRAARWLASRRARWAAVALSIVVSLPALTVGFVHDDFLQRLVLEGAVPGYPAHAHELYDFTRDPPLTGWMIEQGYMPWFTHEELALRFFRPISGALLGLDHALFGRDALLAHAHSLLWLLACVVATSSVHRRMLRPATANVATAIYGLAGAHAVTTSWLAARHTLVAATFGAIAIASHLAWRERGSRGAAFLAPAAVSLSLLSSETGLGAVAFIACYELLVPRERGLRRLACALPSLALAAAHLAFYVLVRYGTRHSGAYASPFDDPAAFAGALVRRSPILLGDLYGALPSDLGVAEPLAIPLAIYGLVTCGACYALAWRAPIAPVKRRRLAFLALASVLCLAPMVGGVIGGRLLPIALIGASAVVATAMVETWRSAARGSRARIALRALAVVLAVLHFGLSPLVRVSEASFMGAIGRAEEEYAREADLSACEDRQLAYILTGSDPVNSLFAAPILYFHAPEKIREISRARVLSMAPHGHVLTVTGADRFELRVIDGPREVNLFERVYTDAPVASGTRVVAGELTARVLDHERDLPARVAFEVDGGLERVCFVEWRGGKLRAFAPPPIGRERVVVRELGPMGM